MSTFLKISPYPHVDDGSVSLLHIAAHYQAHKYLKGQLVTVQDGLAQIFLTGYSNARQFILIYSLQIMGNLLYTIAVILIIIWLLGFLGFNSFGMGNIIHVLLVIAIIAVVLRLIQGRGV